MDTAVIPVMHGTFCSRDESNALSRSSIVSAAFAEAVSALLLVCCPSADELEVSSGSVICCEAGDDVSGLPVAAFCCFFFFKESLIKGVRQTFFFCACLFSKSFKGDLNPGSENLEVPRTRIVSVLGKFWWRVIG